MANITAPNGPFWPLGPITVATPGTPVPLTQNLNALGQSYTSTGSSAYAAAFNQWLLQAGAANTGNIYLIYPGGSKADPNTIILALIPGQFYALSTSARNGNVFGLNDFVIDADTANDFVQVTGLVA